MNSGSNGIHFPSAPPQGGTNREYRNVSEVSPKTMTSFWTLQGSLVSGIGRIGTAARPLFPIHRPAPTGCPTTECPRRRIRSRSIPASPPSAGTTSAPEAISTGRRRPRDSGVTSARRGTGTAGSRPYLIVAPGNASPASASALPGLPSQWLTRPMEGIRRDRRHSRIRAIACPGCPGPIVTTGMVRRRHPRWYPIRGGGQSCGPRSARTPITPLMQNR